MRIPIAFSGIPAALLASAALLLPRAAFAQDVPSYAQPTVVSTDETIHGRIASVDGAFDISVDDDRGFVDHVTLHQGTIINPTGLTLAPGMSVTIAGYNAGSTFDANEIDTPYSYSGPLPTPVYYGPGYWCPGFAYGYGPSFSIALVFGGGYRFEHEPFYGRPWNGHAYFGDYVGRPYLVGRDHIGYERHVVAGDGRRELDDAARRDAHSPAAFAGGTFAGRDAAERGFAGERSAAVRSAASGAWGGARREAIGSGWQRPAPGYAGAARTFGSGGQPNGGAYRAEFSRVSPGAGPRREAPAFGGGFGEHAGGGFSGHAGGGFGGHAGGGFGGHAGGGFGGAAGGHGGHR